MRNIIKRYREDSEKTKTQRTAKIYEPILHSTNYVISAKKPK